MATPETPQQQIARRLTGESGEYILARTVPLFAKADGGALQGHGSGVLLEIADASFILTAAHVFDEDERAIREPGPNVIPRAILVGAGPHRPIVGLDGLAFQVTHDRDNVDFAFMRLPEHVAAELRVAKRFLRLDQVDIRRSHEVSSYCAFGYPVVFSKVAADGVVDTTPVCHFSDLHENCVNVVEGTTIAIQFHDHYDTSSGEPIRPPEMRGISGGGIWRILAESDLARGVWDPSMIRLAAIEHRVLSRNGRNEAIMGVLIRRVIATIREAHPDLRQTIDSHDKQR